MCERRDRGDGRARSSRQAVWRYQAGPALFRWCAVALIFWRSGAGSPRSALVLYTIVDNEAREFMTRSGEELGVPVVDLIGQLSPTRSLLNRSPAGRPGIPRLTRDYFRRNEAVEFTIKHDGQMTGDLDQADIVLVDPRTSKTPSPPTWPRRKRRWRTFLSSSDCPCCASSMRSIRVALLPDHRRG